MAIVRRCKGYYCTTHTLPYRKTLVVGGRRSDGGPFNDGQVCAILAIVFSRLAQIEAVQYNR